MELVELDATEEEVRQIVDKANFQNTSVEAFVVEALKTSSMYHENFYKVP